MIASHAEKTRQIGDRMDAQALILDSQNSQQRTGIVQSQKNTYRHRPAHGNEYDIL